MVGGGSGESDAAAKVNGAEAVGGRHCTREIFQGCKRQRARPPIFERGARPLASVDEIEIEAKPERLSTSEGSQIHQSIL